MRAHGISGSASRMPTSGSRNGALGPNKKRKFEVTGDDVDDKEDVKPNVNRTKEEEVIKDELSEDGSSTYHTTTTTGGLVDLPFHMAVLPPTAAATAAAATDDGDDDDVLIVVANDNADDVAVPSTHLPLPYDYHANYGFPPQTSSCTPEHLLMGGSTDWLHAAAASYVASGPCYWNVAPPEGHGDTENA